MRLILGPENLSTDFSFSIEDANQVRPKTYDSLGVYFSGGIDSTALLLLLLSELKMQGVLERYPVHCFTVIKQDYSVDISTPVLDAISRKFQTKIYHHNRISNYGDKVSNIHIKTLLSLYIKHKNMLFFVGNNKMPPESIKKFNNVLNTDYGEVQDRVVFYSPFLFLHKPQILDIFYKLNCEDILPYTYSCTVQPHIPCNNCYACEERAWGFEMLKKQDPLFAQN
jgi:hypothetical protein